MEKPRDNFIFHRSWYEASKYMTPNMKATFLDAVMAYYLDGIEPPDDGATKPFVVLTTDKIHKQLIIKNHME